MALKTRKPTGQVPPPVILLEGETAWTIIGVRELADRRRRRDLAAVLLRRLAEQDATQATSVRRVNTEFASIVAPLADLDGLDRTLTDLYLIPTQHTGGNQ